MTCSAREPARSPCSRVWTGVCGCLPERESPPARGRVGSLGGQPLGLSRRRLRLRVRPGRAERGRAHLPPAARSGCHRLALRRRARRSLPPRARAVRVGHRPLRPDRRGGVRRRSRRAGARRLRARDRRDDRQRAVPLGAGGADADPRDDAERADGGERRREHDREPRVLPRPCVRRAPARRHRHRRRLRPHGRPARRSRRCSCS